MYAGLLGSYRFDLASAPESSQVAFGGTRRSVRCVRFVSISTAGEKAGCQSEVREPEGGRDAQGPPSTRSWSLDIFAFFLSDSGVSSQLARERG